MATSGSINFTVSTKEIIKEAYELLGVIGEGTDPNADQIDSALRTLNMMTKTWQADGLNLFAVQEVFLFLKKTQKKYSLASTSADHFTASFTETTTDATAASAATQISLTTPGSIAVGDYIGVKTDAGDVLHWTTVSSIASSPLIDLTVALPAAVSSGVVVYYYTTKANRPMRVLEGYTVRNTTTSTVDVPVEVIARVGYGELSNKAASGVPNQVYFDPQIGTASLNVWPTTDSEKDYLRLFVQRTLSDFDCLHNTPDYPQEWFLPLATSLAVLLSPKFAVPRETFQRITIIAGQMYETARGFDDEHETSLYFSPDGRSQ